MGRGGALFGTSQAILWCRRGAGELVGRMARFRMAGCPSSAAAFTAYCIDSLRAMHMGMAVDFYTHMLSPMLHWVHFHQGEFFVARL